MSVAALSESTQNYVKAVWSLSEWSDEPVTASTIAARVGVKLSTASDAIRKLTEQGLLDHARYGSVTLTDEGRSHALAMVRRHRLIETFLVEVLGYRWDQVHDEAETLEHAVSDFMVERLDEHLGHPERDPHGDPIPSAAGEVHRPNAQLLSSVGEGQRVRVERVADDDPGLLQFFADHGIGYGSVLVTRPAAPYSDAVEVVVEQPARGGAGSQAAEGGGSNASNTAKTPLPLGRSATDSVWVEVL
ncbi:metal-dependent transcriptional regulator [Leucobacter chinensis]|uniref:metal-dependent transcriptional regulator n=1 Tax=Leucobacter chinensis TaxID=2851010 RepID=UPI001C248D24|nr:metal-dependent transcriptional regulator [Leucobacter chinensis]